jgi:hypothetical protein
MYFENKKFSRNFWLDSLSMAVLTARDSAEYKHR